MTRKGLGWVLRFEEKLHRTQGKGNSRQTEDVKYMEVCTRVGVFGDLKVIQ